MKAYLISLAVGVVVGAFYGLLGVRSPAPPLIALAGLLGMVVGEQTIPLAKHLLAGRPPAVASEKTDRAAEALGRLPGESSTKHPGV
jgi:XapX domain-containing protein